MTTASGHTQAIRASEVIGTSVNDTQGKKIGEIEDVVLDKLSNNIMFAAVSFGGFLGIGEKYHAIPWSELEYSKDKDGYVVRFTKEQLAAAPCDSMDELTRNDGMAYRDKSYEYFKTTRYWEP